MFFRKSEKSSSHPCIIMTVGVLALVGAVCITNKGKEIMKCAGQKMMNFFKKEADMIEDMTE